MRSCFDFKSLTFVSGEMQLKFLRGFPGKGKREVSGVGFYQTSCSLITFNMNRMNCVGGI